MKNVADLPDPANSGKTIRQVNNEKAHAYHYCALVELESGARLFVVNKGRDCDGTPLYSLSPHKVAGRPSRQLVMGGYPEESLKLIR